MNRKIKFRGKRLDNGELVYGDLLHHISSCHIVSYDETEENDTKRADFHYYDVDPDSVSQFTGLFAHDGSEIYDGDILCTKRGDVYEYIKVYWDEKYAAFLADYYTGSKKIGSYYHCVGRLESDKEKRISGIFSYSTQYCEDK